MRIQKSNIRIISLSWIVLLVGFVHSTSLHADQIMVEESVRVNAPAKAVWAFIGGFQVLDRWHPDVATSKLIGTGKEIGDIRVLTLHNDARIVEKLEFYDEATMTLRYTILESPLPIKNYHATVSVKSVGANEAEVIWKSTLTAVGTSDEEVIKVISNIYLAGLNTLNKLYK